MPVVRKGDREKWQAPRGEVELVGERKVIFKTPGIMYEIAAFEQLPDLQKYRDVMQQHVEGKAPLSQTDQAYLRRLYVLLIVHCAVEPRFSEGEQPKDGSVSISELTAADFWKLGNAIQTFDAEQKAREAEEIGNFSTGGESN